MLAKVASAIALISSVSMATATTLPSLSQSVGAEPRIDLILTGVALGGEEYDFDVGSFRPLGNSRRFEPGMGAAEPLRDLLVETACTTDGACMCAPSFGEGDVLAFLDGLSATPVTDPGTTGRFVPLGPIVMSGFGDGPLTEATQPVEQGAGPNVRSSRVAKPSPGGRASGGSGGSGGGSSFSGSGGSTPDASTRSATRPPMLMSAWGPVMGSVSTGPTLFHMQASPAGSLSSGEPDSELVATPLPLPGVLLAAGLAALALLRRRRTACAG